MTSENAESMLAKITAKQNTNTTTMMVDPIRSSCFGHVTLRSSAITS